MFGGVCDSSKVCLLDCDGEKVQEIDRKRKIEFIWLREREREVFDYSWEKFKENLWLLWTQQFWSNWPSPCQVIGFWHFLHKHLTMSSKWRSFWHQMKTHNLSACLTLISVIDLSFLQWLSESSVPQFDLYSVKFYAISWQLIVW